jgi:FkbM family methyltransferase
MLLTFLLLILDKILYLIDKIKMYRYFFKYIIINNRIFGNYIISYISYINPKYIFFFKFKDLIYEYPLPIIMAKIIKEGDIVVDIGANQGQYTIFLSKLVGQKGKVYAFEPDPRNFLILKHRTRKLKNVIIERKAVGNKNSKVKFYLDKFLSMSTIYKGTTTSPIACLEIHMVSLDEYFLGFKRDIALVKMDVQGSEPLVLDGMKRLIKKVKLLILELWPYGLKVAGFEPSDIINRLILNDFKIIYIDEDFYVITRNIEKYVNIDHKNIYYYINIIEINKNYLKI